MLISIITPTYNSAKTLKDTLESILSQTYQNYELIVIDGVSSDETLAIVEAYAPMFEGKITIVSENDKGIYDAMNKGIARAKGEIVGILNSDDFFVSSTVLETIAKGFKNKDIDAIYADLDYVSAQDLKRVIRHYSSRIFRPSLMRLGFIPAHPTFYCKKEIYQKYGNFDITYQIAADFDLLLRFIYIHRINTLYIPQTFVAMRTGGVSNANLANRKVIFKEHKKALKKNGVYSNTFFFLLRYGYKIGELIYAKLFIR